MKSLTAGLAIALTAIAVGAPPKSTITKVTKASVGGGIEIAVMGENLSEPKAFFLSDRTLFVVQFDAALLPASGKLTVNAAGLDYVRYARYSANPPIARLVLQVDKGVTPVVSQENGTWFVRVGVTTPKPAAKPKDIDDDSAAMNRAIGQLGSSAGSNGTKIALGKDQGANLLTPGTIIGFDKTAAFKEAVFANRGVTVPVAPAPIGSPFADTNISLVTDLVDVLFVFKAFSQQTGVNIVTSPDVSPKEKPLLLTLSMRNVDLDFAMTTVASLANLRFTRLGNTFIVTHASDFYEKVGHIIRNSGVDYESRVVEIQSGEASQIREATKQTIPQDGPDGYYDILDPTKATAAAGTGPANLNTGAATGTAGTANPGTPAVGGASSPRAKYVMLIGEPRRLNDVETYVRDLDKRITESFSLAGAANYGSVVVPIISGQTEKIKQMLGSLLAQNPRKDDYTIEETSVKELAEGDDSLKMLLIAGPKDELETLRIFADHLDASMCELKGIVRDTDPESFKQMYEVVDLKYIEPTHAEFDLKSRIRGLYVTVLPDPVTPGLSGEATDEKVDGGNANAGAASGGTAATPKTAEMKRQVGHEQMRLVLRGTKAQILDAKAYLAQVDMPARQVSIELRVMEINKADALKIGLDWSVLTGGRLTSFRMNQGLGGNISQGGVFSGHYQDNATSSLDVLGQLDQITTRDNLIARPNALITDGRSSHLFVGDTVRYIKLINASQNGTTVEIGEVEVGVKVDVEARVGADGNIALDLRNNFSILRSFTPVPGGGAIPQTSDRTTEMFVNMKHGETIALGGLILEQDRRQVSGIPILKDIPIIGYLFKRTENNKMKSEIVFFLTATVIDNGNKATAADPRRNDGQAPTTANNSKGN
ncbi:MAG: hypothetical protein WD716_13220 [Fimbriimonadaceae bacterium]